MSATPTPALEAAIETVPDLLLVVFGLVAVVWVVYGAYLFGKSQGRAALRSSSRSRRPFTPSDSSAILEGDDGFAFAIDPVDDGVSFSLVRRSDTYRSGWAEVSSEWIAEEHISDVALALEWAGEYLAAREELRREQLDQLESLGFAPEEAHG